MSFGRPDRAFMMPQWVFGDTVKRWQQEGMPKDVHFNDFFGFDRYEGAPINIGLVPGLESEVESETEEYKIIRDELGGRARVWKDREIGMPQWLDYPLKDRASWESIKARLDPDSPCRYPLYWEDLKRCWKGRDYPLGIHGGSYYGWLRNWAGVEGLSMMYYDDPELVHEMTDYVGDFVFRTIRRAVEEVDFDFALFWEDMAHKTGSLLSPALFREFMLPSYKKVSALLHEHGVDVQLVDSDGNVDELIPLWLEGGLTGVYPCEVAAGCDVVAYREKYGKDLILIGGIDKRALRTTREAVEEEVMGRAPKLLESGGYVPFVDHAVPPDVPLDCFQHYLRLVKQIQGLPTE